MSTSTDNYANINNDVAGIENITSFSGYFDNRYLETFTTGNGFIFVTKPLLFIEPVKPTSTSTQAMLAYNNMKKEPKFVPYLSSEGLNNSDKILPKILSYNEDYSDSNFLPMFTNNGKNMDGLDTVLEQDDSFNTKQGYKITLPTHTTISTAANVTSISVEETANLDFTKLIALWVEYIANVTDGTFNANPACIEDGSLDYMCSIYYFAVKPDGRTIKFWTKYTGCWPTTIPYGNFKYTKGQHDIAELDIPFVYTVKEDMNPQILEEFNITSLKLSGYGKLSDITDDYASIRNSKLLSKTGLAEYSSLVDSTSRGPIVLLETGSAGSNIDNTEDRFILSFGLDTSTNTFVSDKFGDTYIYNPNEFFAD